MVQPCVDLWSVLNDTLESFIVSELLKVPKSGQRSTGGQRLPRPLDYSDEDDDEVLTGIMLEVCPYFCITTLLVDYEYHYCCDIIGYYSMIS